MLIRKALSARRFLAVFTLLVSVVSNTEALLGQVRDGREHSENSTAAGQHALTPISGENIQIGSAVAGPNQQQKVPAHSHVDSNDHCAHQHGVGMILAVKFDMGLALFARDTATPIPDHGYLPDRSMKEPPRA